MLSRLPIILVQLQAGNNSEKNWKWDKTTTIFSLLLKNLTQETVFMNTENSKRNESNKFSYNFTDKLNLKNPNKNSAFWLI